MYLAYIDRHLRPVRVLDGGIIALNPLIVDELGCLQTLSAPERGSGGFTVGASQAGVRTSQAAFSNAALGKQKTRQSATAACDGMESLGREEPSLFTVRRVGADTPAPRTTTLNSRLQIAVLAYSTAEGICVL